MWNKHLQRIPWDLAGEASGDAPSAGLAVAGVAVPLGAFEVDGSTGANGPEDDVCLCAWT